MEGCGVGLCVFLGVSPPTRVGMSGERGDPNHFGAPHWPLMFNATGHARRSRSVPGAWSESSNVVMRFDVGLEGGVRPQTHLRQAACDFMAALFNNRNSSDS